MRRGGDYEKLVENIILQAVDDWSYLIRRDAYDIDGKEMTVKDTAGNILSFRELREFFQSGWFASMLDFVGFKESPETVLCELEKKRRAKRCQRRTRHDARRCANGT